MPPPSTVGCSCVYIVRRGDGRFYCGQTDELKGRLNRHRSKAGKVRGGGRMEAAYLVVPSSEQGQSTAKVVEAQAIQVPFPPPPLPSPITWDKLQNVSAGRVACINRNAQRQPTSKQIPWAAQYNTWPFIKVTQKGVFLSFLLVSFKQILTQSRRHHCRGACLSAGCAVGRFSSYA